MVRWVVMLSGAAARHGYKRAPTPHRLLAARYHYRGPATSSTRQPHGIAVRSAQTPAPPPPTHLRPRQLHLQVPQLRLVGGQLGEELGLDVCHSALRKQRHECGEIWMR